MKQVLTVSARGQLTLPANLRRRLGLDANSTVTAEEVDGRIVLTPATVIETPIYSDEQIAKWNQADTFAAGERDALLRRVRR